MPTPTPFEAEMLQMMRTMQSDIGELKSDMVEVKDRLSNIESTVFDLREEVREESIATRSLLNQAFEHISDQMASKDQSIQPSMVFRHSRSRTRLPA